MAHGDEPIRAELFSAERMAEHAESLAAAQTVAASAQPDQALMARVLENGRVLRASYRAIVLTIQQKRTITPAAEWLVDNFTLVDQQLREIQANLPPAYYRLLPALAGGHLQGYPRVFGLAWAFVAHTDSRFDPEGLRAFVRAYQRVQPLTIGELWALPLTLRVILVENLRRLAEAIVRGRADRDQADLLADRLLGLGGQTPVAVPALDLGRYEKQPLPAAFAVQLVQRLRDLDSRARPALRWLDQRLAAQATSADDVVRAEHQRQGAVSVTVRNIITSMRALSVLDWPEFFEGVSLVDQRLRQSPAYATMDFPTRDAYRHAIEDLARGSGLAELDIAQRVLARAQAATQLDAPRQAEPGFYLIAEGRPAFEREIGYRAAWTLRAARIGARAGLSGYLGGIALLTAAALALPLAGTGAALGGTAAAALLLLALLPASELAMALVNRAVALVLGPRRLPRLELPRGAPPGLRSLVAMPVLLASAPDLERDLARLEVHYLANPDGELHFALLSDWLDAATETAADDQALLATARAGIAALNQRYGPAPSGGERFLLYQRRRVWNPGQRAWMGWERKRGKLHELNRLLRGAADTTFLPWLGLPPAVPADVRYVITLDADTHLPRGAADRLIGTLAHPLNQPRFVAGRIVAGYALVQPRITPLLPTGRAGSFFQWASSGASGIDPYAGAISDVYQDLFGEGSYTGKAIYDVDAFEAALAGRVPANAVLSHDLFEGIAARTALATDIELFEDFPSDYAIAAARQHRWARGDWQLLPWLCAPHHPALPAASPMSALGKWKILDNLRRTLLAPAAWLALLAAWLLPLPAAAIWSGFVLATLALPLLLPLFAGLLSCPRGASGRSRGLASLADLGLAAAQVALAVTFLAYQAWLMLDAILRTLCRLFLTHRNLLEWAGATPAALRAKMPARLWGAYSGGGVLVALSLAALLLGHGRAWLAAPWLLLWMAAPFLARRISRPPRSLAAQPLSPPQTRALRALARRTWRFFEVFVSAADHMLPPDGLQDDPHPLVAHRTSPTNIGLSLLATLAAHDFGWLGTLELTERLEATLATVSRLERHRGHLYNWYDTSTLCPLEPRYVSSVDSGNLAGHLLALAQGCRELMRRSSLNPGRLAGLEDAARLLAEAQARLVDCGSPQAAGQPELAGALHAFTAALAPPPLGARDWADRWADLGQRAAAVAARVQTLVALHGEASASELGAWAEVLASGVASHARDAALLLPWTRLGAPAGAAAWPVIAACFSTPPTLAEAPARCAAALHAIAQRRTELIAALPANAHLVAALEPLEQAFRASAAEATDLLLRLDRLAQTADALFSAMDFAFLFDPVRKLLSLGYRANDQSLDPICYDLLASEARLASFVAIAKGDLPTAHWFRLGRALVPVGRGSALLSWSGSMFEYLMPELVMQPPPASLLGQSCALAVRRQQAYGAERGVPWGISESAYNTRNLHLTYQYSSFGVPGLGLKRGLAGDLVVAPYATALASLIDPRSAAANFARLDAAGAAGAFGFYDALDYTPARLPPGESVAVVRAYLAHHQGMTLVALDNVLGHDAMRARFRAQPLVQATELLLQERTPRYPPAHRLPVLDDSVPAQVRAPALPIPRSFSSPHDPAPQTHLLSNGSYSVMLTAAGSGFSRWRGLALTRWREDATCDAWGSFVYLRDLSSGEVWSAGYQPCALEAASYQASFYEDRAEILRRDRALATLIEVVVSPEDDAELRRISVTNHGLTARHIEITSFAELVLAPPAADSAHPAFSNLFVETEFVPSAEALLATRRRRSDSEAEIWLAHLATVEGAADGDLQFETDRARFLGRGRDARRPDALLPGATLSNTVGPVLDPALSLRRTLQIPPGATARIVFATVVADSRAAALALADKCRGPGYMERTLALAWTHAQVQLHHLGIEAGEAQLFQRLASPLLFSAAALRPPSEALSRGCLELSALWAHGLSGDLPIVLARLDDDEGSAMVRQLLRAHEYWQRKQLAADVIIVNGQFGSYERELQNSLEALVRGSQNRLPPDPTGSRGHLLLLRRDQISNSDNALLETVARAVLLASHGSLSEQIARAQRPPASPPARPRAAAHAHPAAAAPTPPPLEFANGLGGFLGQGREYVITLAAGARTPRPWVNVVANPDFGFLASESGSGYTWSLNSRENQLTPWSNDPVADPAGEALYLRDEISGEVWCPTALPIRDDAAAYTVHHGQGYTRFLHASRGIALQLLQFVPLADAIKISRLRLRNASSRPRRLSVTAYAEWVLGSARPASAPYLVTELDPETGALFARNLWQGEFGGRIAFADLAGRQSCWTADRAEFLGRNRGAGCPAALDRATPLSGAAGAGLDPCAALQTTFTLDPGASLEVVFFLGQAPDRESARELLARYRSADLDAVLRTVTDYWDHVLGTLQVSTPDRGADLLLNRWLLYQTIACRLWARTACYQASGAYGFRDQLQDVMALCVAQPQLVRQHLLRAAGRQFLAGDVQHWWHPPSGRGVRSRISDDAVWLPYAAIRYLEVTGDQAVLDEAVPFLAGDALAPEQAEAYFQPRPSAEHASLFEHCARALDRSLAVGSHGLPLIGGGDWNDGFNHLGRQGRGESVWLGWFLHTTLWEFAKIADARGEPGRAEAWRLHVSALKAALEREAWDGAWYRRAFYDDGSPLGSAADQECRIDAIAQSWGILSGAAEPARGARAMAAVARELVRRPAQLALLFAPPFEHTTRDPGYIKAYVPGIRENGGQYTHAAAWSVFAFAALGDGDNAADLLRMLNPIHRSATPAGALHYGVEPYVVAADVYSEAPHTGRGGWTWYTGSAGWLYRAGIEAILGFRLGPAGLSLDPCIPRRWPGFSMTFLHRSATFAIHVDNPRSVCRGITSLHLDGQPLPLGPPIPLPDDAHSHLIQAILG
ncbi:MAG TPA: glucoamylase family protein [Terriglobales bacterium]|nr:glucoamylase family protein [Terriglobales bacterium]